jgi:hypothetical protein
MLFKENWVLVLGFRAWDFSVMMMEHGLWGLFVQCTFGGFFGSILIG